MRNSWRSPLLRGILSCALGAVAVLSLTSAKSSDSGTAPGTPKQYVLMADGGWSDVQDAVVAGLGATIDYRHRASGIAMVTSTDTDFLFKAMQTGVIGRGAEDMVVQWTSPAEAVAELELEEEAITAGNETFVNEQWNLVAVEAQGAWDAGLTGLGVRVAVIDGGLHAAHVDIAPNLDVARSASFVPGFNFNQDTGTFWHATHVAGIIAAADNSIGTIGIAPEATLIGVKALHNGSGSFSAVIAGILYASDPIAMGGAGADIINMSLGATFARGGGNTGAGALISAMNRAVNYATEQGVLVVCSAGNNGLDLDHSGSVISVPAQSGSGIAVSATGPVGYAVGWPAGATNFRRPASYTNYGQSVIWVAAPGGDDVYTPTGTLCTIPRCCGGNVTVPCWVHDLVMSTTRGSGGSISTYGWSDGTSMAAPAAAAVAAIIKQRFPSFSANDLKTFLAQTADGVGGSDPLRPYYGQGFVNARRAATDDASLMFLSGSTPVRGVAMESDLALAITRNGSAQPGISFTLPAAGLAQLDLFDVAGRRVASLFDGPAAAGRTDVSWSRRALDGGAIVQGAYFLRLQSGSSEATQKLVLLGE